MTYIQHTSSGNGVAIWPVQPTDGNLLLMFTAIRTTISYPVPNDASWISLGPTASCIDNNTTGFGDLAAARAFSKIASSEPLTVTVPSSRVTMFEFPPGAYIDGTVALDCASANDPAVICGGPITPSGPGAEVYGFANVGEFFAVTVTPGAGVTLIDNFPWFSGPDSPILWSGSKVVPAPVATTIDGSTTGTSGHIGPMGVTISIRGFTVPGLVPFQQVQIIA